MSISIDHLVWSWSSIVHWSIALVACRLRSTASNCFFADLWNCRIQASTRRLACSYAIAQSSHLIGRQKQSRSKNLLFTAIFSKTTLIRAFLPSCNWNNQQDRLVSVVHSTQPPPTSTLILLSHWAPVSSQSFWQHDPSVSFSHWKLSSNPWNMSNTTAKMWDTLLKTIKKKDLKNPKQKKINTNWRNGCTFTC